MSEKTYQGKCFCGAVEITVTGTPVVMGYCHCDSCRSWSASPVNAFSLWKPESVGVTKGKEQLGVFHRTESSYRQFCKACGGHVMTEHPGFKLIDVYVALLKDFPFEPTVHVNYGEKTLSVRDGLPKFKDMPQEMGGSGGMLPD